MILPGLTGAIVGAAKRATTTWNPNDAASGFTFSNSNLTWVNSTTQRSVRATTSRSAGKFYFEFTVNSTALFLRLGLANAAFSLGSGLGGDVAGNGIGYSSAGGYYLANHSTSSYAAFAAGDVIGVAFDAGSNLVWFAKNGVWQNAGTPSSGSGGVGLTSSGGAYFPASSTGATGSGNSGCTANFGQAAFNYTPPTGFLPWG